MSLYNKQTGPIEKFYIGKIPKKNELYYNDKYSEDKLTYYRTIGDPTGDAVIESLHKKYGLTNIFDLLNTVKEKAKLENINKSKDRIFNDFLDEASYIPDWVNLEEVRIGQRLFAKLTPFMNLSLLCGSLVGGSNFTNAAVTTLLAGNFNDPTRRIEETGVLLSWMAFEGELEPGKKAHESLCRVRLLHSGLRHWLVSSKRYTRTDERPINQHDLAITLGVFGYQNLRSMRRMNIYLTDYENHCYMMMWRWAGHILGIDKDLLPNSLIDQRDFWYASLKHQANPELVPTNEILDFLDKFAEQFNKESYGLVPLSFIKPLLYETTLYLNGDDWMSIKKESNWPVYFLKSMGSLFGYYIPNYIPFAEDLMIKANLFAIKQRINSNRNKTAGKGMKTGTAAPKEINLKSKKFDKVKQISKL